jgi:hypothetical protein
MAGIIGFSVERLMEMLTALGNGVGSSSERGAPRPRQKRAATPPFRFFSA